MNSPRAGGRVAAVIFGMICLAHAGRVLAHLELRVGSYDVPQWPSAVAAFLTGALCLWLWRLSATCDRT